MSTRSGTSAKRRREAASGTVKLLERRTAALEAKEELTNADKQSALRITQLVGDVSLDFKTYHHTIVNQIEDDEEAKKEQETLERHEMQVMDLIDRLSQLVDLPMPTKPIAEKDLLRKRINHVEKAYRMVKGRIDERGLEMDVYALGGQEKRINDLQLQSKEIEKDILSIEDAPELEKRRVTLEQLLYDVGIEVSRLAGSKEDKPPLATSGMTEMSRIKLPRIEIPSFDGNILNWRLFWEQFESAIHSQSHLSNSDKLTYLREALKSGPAKSVVVGLTQTSDNYEEAIKCLKKCYDRPRVLHQAHVRKIQEAFPLKTGSGQELRRLHDHLSQHIRALKASEDYDIDTYLTAAIEMKLDEGTKLLWTQHSSKSEKTPPCEEILEFLDTQARHYESVAHSGRSISKTTTKAAYTTRPENTCVACKQENHPLNTCVKFQNMSRDERWTLVKKNGFCMNCLKAGHMASRCRAQPACRKCRKTHNTLLHIESKPSEEPTTESVSSATHVPQTRKGKQVLLMTRRAKIIAPDGSTTQARVFLDPGASYSFVTEKLAQQLRLPRRKDNSLVAGIAGVNATRTRGAVSFTVAHVSGRGRQIHVENAFVLSKVCMDMPVSPVDSISRWKHLAGLDLADPDFGTPARVDVLLGADYYGEILLHGRRWGPRGTPYAQRTCLGWVIAGPLQSNDSQPAAYTCCMHVEEDALKKFWEIEDYNMKQPVLSQEEKKRGPTICVIILER